MPRSISFFVNFRAAKVLVNQFAPFLVQYQLVARLSKAEPNKKTRPLRDGLSNEKQTILTAVVANSQVERIVVEGLLAANGSGLRSSKIFQIGQVLQVISEAT